MSDSLTNLSCLACQYYNFLRLGKDGWRHLCYWFAALRAGKRAEPGRAPLIIFAPVEIDGRSFAGSAATCR